MNPLSKAFIKIKPKMHLTYKLKDFVGKDDEFIKTSCTGTISVDIETLSNNFDLFKKIIKFTKIKQINCIDYESALFLEENLEGDLPIALVDDYENKDRSYIDTTKFIKHKLYVPLTYFMWNVKFKDSCNVYCLRLNDFDTMVSLNGDKVLYKDILIKIREILTQINTQNLTDLDKCILVSNYLQSKVQYTEDGYESHADKVYVIEAEEQEVTKEKVGSLTSVITENYGLCIAIANATTLLLNNPILNVNTRSVYGNSHVWSLVTLDNKKYYMDNTWSITRNKNRVEGALKAQSFSDEYLLFGEEKATSIGHHNCLCYIDGILEKEDYSREEIKDRVKKLSKQHKFDNYSYKLRFNSKVK